MIGQMMEKKMNLSKTDDKTNEGEKRYRWGINIIQLSLSLMNFDWAECDWYEHIPPEFIMRQIEKCEK